MGIEDKLNDLEASTARGTMPNDVPDKIAAISTCNTTLVTGTTVRRVYSAPSATSTVFVTSAWAINKTPAEPAVIYLQTGADAPKAALIAENAGTTLATSPHVYHFYPPLEFAATTVEAVAQTTANGDTTVSIVGYVGKTPA